MTGPALLVKDLSVNYLERHSGSKSALKGINFSLAAGEILGIIGESGAGKTTLGLSLIGLNDHGSTQVSGEIMFNGVNLLDLDEASLCLLRGSGIGMIFQDARGSLDPATPVYMQVERLIRRHSSTQLSQVAKNSLAILGEMGITPEILHRAPYAHQLSGGLCQRAAIATALACEPKILIADEPTSSLDTVTQARIVSLLREKRSSKGLAVIFISHDLPLVASLADNIVVLSRGSILEQGSPEDIINHPKSDFTRELISSWKQLIV